MVAFKSVAAIGMIVIAVVAFGVGLVASPLLFPPAKAEDPIWDRVTEDGKIVVGTEPGWPPYEFINASDQIDGFEIELTRMIAEKLDLDVELRNMAFDAIIPSVQAMDIDLGVSGFSIKPDRLEVVDFTMYHSITEGQIIMLQSRANALGITELTSLTNLTTLRLKVGAQQGTTQLDELAEIAPSSLRTYQDYLLALTDMNESRIDAIYAETPITSNWILEAEETTKPIVVVFRRPYWPVAFVVNKNAQTFLAKINGALAEIIAEGDLDVLKEKWKS